MIRVSGIIIQNDRFLIARQKPFNMEEFYCFPGGSKKPRESAMKALYREIREEANIEVLSCQLIGLGELYSHNKDTIDLFFYINQYRIGDIAEYEHIKHKGCVKQLLWMGKDGINKVDFKPREARKYLEDNKMFYFIGKYSDSDN